MNSYFRRSIHQPLLMHNYQKLIALKKISTYNRVLDINYKYPTEYLSKANVKRQRACTISGNRVLLAARRLTPICGRCRSSRVGGMTLTSAPVSTRKRMWRERSMRKKRRLLFWPGWLVAIRAWPVSFPPRSKDHSISLLLDQTWHGTSTSRQMYEEVPD